MTDTSADALNCAIEFAVPAATLRAIRCATGLDAIWPRLAAAALRLAVRGLFLGWVMLPPEWGLRSGRPQWAGSAGKPSLERFDQAALRFLKARRPAMNSIGCDKKKKPVNHCESTGLVKNPNHALDRLIGLRMSPSILVLRTPETSPLKGNLIFVAGPMVQAFAKTHEDYRSKAIS